MSLKKISKEKFCVPAYLPSCLYIIMYRIRSLMFIVLSLYRFTRFDNPIALAEPLQKKCEENGILGSILLANEGINGTISGQRKAINTILEFIRSLPGCEELECKESTSKLPPFPRMKIKIKKEIITMSEPNIDPTKVAGNYVDARDWNELIQSPDVALIDTRNNYEVAIGSFEGAINPETKSFSDFPKWWQKNKNRFLNKKIAMYCTGGIRCEKSTNYIIGQGVENVYQLKGGILKYLELVPKKESKWTGDCFVFDARVSIGHNLKEGPHKLCYACRLPIKPSDMQKPEYEHGVSCPHCHKSTSDSDKNRFRERQKQIKLSRQRGTKHMAGFDGN